MIHFPALEDFDNRKEWESACWAVLEKNIDSSNCTVFKLFVSLLSKRERLLFMRRMIVVDRLQNKHRFMDILRETWLSPSSISAVKKSIEKGEYDCGWERTKILKQKRIEEEWRKRAARRYPKIYRRSKYGKIAKF